jgi:hypothetical protein
MADGFVGIYTPHNTKEWEAVVADIRSEFNANALLLQSTAAILRKKLPHAKNVRGRRGLAGADLHIAAIQIARHWNQAAAAQYAASAALTKSDAIFHGTFAGAGPQSSHGQFDAG